MLIHCVTVARGLPVRRKVTVKYSGPCWSYSINWMASALTARSRYVLPCGQKLVHSSDLLEKGRLSLFLTGTSIYKYFVTFLLVIVYNVCKSGIGTCTQAPWVHWVPLEYTIYQLNLRSVFNMMS